MAIPVLQPQNTPRETSHLTGQLHLIYRRSLRRRSLRRRSLRRRSLRRRSQPPSRGL